MNFPLSFPQILELVEPIEVIGEGTPEIQRIASLEDADGGSLTFVTGRRYFSALKGCSAAVVLVPPDCSHHPLEGQVFVKVKKPSMALTTICARLEFLQRVVRKPGIHPSAIIAETAQIEAAATIGPLCVIEENAVIGPEVILEAGVFVGRGVQIGGQTRIYPRVSLLSETKVGSRCLIHSGVVVGADGFGYESTPQGPLKIPQIGKVVIGDDVEIGANSTIDRARFGETVIGSLTKIDNLVQIGHNVKIGQACILCAQVGIGGTTTIEDGVMIGGQAGFAGHLTVREGAKIGAQSGIMEEIPAGQTVGGSPSMPQLLNHKIHVLSKQLPSLFKRVKTLEEQILEEAQN
ncbi:MAG: UDP-3-O-(3-hydroxymyristoyl)glucosamine N-acyltransferase [Opitutales bacterium]|nr:UDP-3-O-(3-hydroxymyristoyl)glucosamine N-acyltransferase [Opitutales bacterium]MCH8539305.1 UDP-3-O-(3-hydroxymyristoyl)glucosamine N-acyltransferase [Opitutales bacterium]